MECYTVLLARPGISNTLFIRATYVDIEASLTLLYLALILPLTRLFILHPTHPILFSLALQIFIIAHVFTEWPLLLRSTSSLVLVHLQYFLSKF